MPIEYGITQHNNIVTWIHYTKGEKKHSSNPDRAFLSIVLFLNDELKKGCNINEFKNMSYIINEFMNNIYIQKKKNNIHKKNTSSVKAIINLLLKKIK